MTESRPLPHRELPFRLRTSRWLGTLATLSIGAAVSLALAHATILFGTISTDPAPGRESEPLLLRLELRDPQGDPVPGAALRAEAQPANLEAAAGGTAAGDVRSAAFEEVAPGRYETTLVLSGAQEWTVALRDATFETPEAPATVSLRLGPKGDDEPVSILFPPAATEPARPSTRIVWLFGLPLVAGLVVTVLVLRGGRESASASEESS